MTRRPPFSAFSARTAPPISSADFFTTARPGQLLRLHPRAVVGKGDGRRFAVRLRGDADMDIRPSAVFAAVVQQVHGNTPQQLTVRPHRHVRHVHRHRRALLLSGHRFQRGAQRQRLRMHRVLADIHSGKGEQPVHQCLHVRLLGVDGLQVALPGGLVLGHALQKSLGVGADGGQRAFQVVGHAGHQLLLLLLRRLLLLQGGL